MTAEPSCQGPVVGQVFFAGTSPIDCSPSYGYSEARLAHIEEILERAQRDQVRISIFTGTGNNARCANSIVIRTPPAAVR
jgi:hypothetical protein